MNLTDLDPITYKIMTPKLNLSDDKIFYTIEGEGELIGQPSVFLRLSSCNLTCKGFASKDSPHGCDSYISWKVKNKYTYDELNEMIAELGYEELLRDNVILKITGGEPLLQQKKLLDWIWSFKKRFKFIPRIDFETNGTILPMEDWLDLDATFTVSPKLSSNGDAERIRYKPEVLQWHDENNSCFKFVIQGIEDINELFENYITKGLIDRKRVWLMPCCGSREEHNETSPLVAELCKDFGFNFSPRLQLMIWDKALKV